MEAVVRARAKGRRFLDDGRDGRRDGDDLLLLDELPQAAQSIAEGLQQLVGGRVVLAEIGQHGFRAAMWIDLGGDLFELLLVAPQVRIADLEQAIQGNVHHLVVQQLLAEILSSQAKIAVRDWQQVFAEKFSKLISAIAAMPLLTAGIRPATRDLSPPETPPEHHVGRT